MARIPTAEFNIIKELEKTCRASEFAKFKSNSIIPSADDSSSDAFQQAVTFLEKAFLDEKFNLLDAIVAETGSGPKTENDTHYRGRVLEAVLNGSFDGKSESDFAYAELKLCELNEKGSLVQIITAGTIFNKNKGKYFNLTNKYEESNFFKKLNNTIIVGYEKVGRQLGFEVKSVSSFSSSDETLFNQLKEDWEFLANNFIAIVNGEDNEFKSSSPNAEMSSRINKFTPNGLLGIRSNGVIITDKLYKLIAR